jgi:hypothetical protein
MSMKTLSKSTLTKRVQEQRAQRKKRKPPDELPQLITLAELAQILRCGHRYARVISRREGFPATVNLGGQPRWNLAEIKAFLGRKSHEPA